MRGTDVRRCGWLNFRRENFRIKSLIEAELRKAFIKHVKEYMMYLLIVVLGKERGYI